MFTSKSVMKNHKTKFRKNREYDEDEAYREKKKTNKQIYRNLKEEEDDWLSEKYSR